MKLEDGLKLQERLIEFAVRILSLADKLPSTPAGKHIRGQIIKSGTSPAPNYSEARNAESSADFIHKLKIVIKELLFVLNQKQVMLISFKIFQFYSPTNNHLSNISL